MLLEIIVCASIFTLVLVIALCRTSHDADEAAKRQYDELVERKRKREGKGDVK